MIDHGKYTPLWTALIDFAAEHDGKPCDSPVCDSLAALRDAHVHVLGETTDWNVLSADTAEFMVWLAEQIADTYRLAARRDDDTSAQIVLNIDSSDGPMVVASQLVLLEFQIAGDPDDEDEDEDDVEDDDTDADLHGDEVTAQAVLAAMTVSWGPRFAGTVVTALIRMILNALAVRHQQLGGAR